MTVDVRAVNREAWNHLVKKGNRWTVPVTSEEVARARQGDWSLILTPSRPVPREWFGELRGRRVLGLASGGGQQGPILAAAGAEVTLFDNSPAQLEQDRRVAERDGLTLHTVEGDMRDLSCFPDQSFDLVFHPCSNCFVPEILPVWREAARVLRTGGVLLSGIVNPIVFCSDLELERQGIAQLKYPIPYSDLDYPEDPEIRKFREDQLPISFGHTLQDQIGGQTQAGLSIEGFYEDTWVGAPEPIHRFVNGYIATLARKR